MTIDTIPPAPDQPERAGYNLPWPLQIVIMGTIITIVFLLHKPATDRQIEAWKKALPPAKKAPMDPSKPAHPQEPR